MKAIKKPTEQELIEIFENPLPDHCEYCGIEYDDFRTGETYETVYDTLWSGSEDPTTWINKTRHTVLGRWHQLKQSQWADHLDQCEEMAESGAQWDFPAPEIEEIEEY